MQQSHCWILSTCHFTYPPQLNSEPLDTVFLEYVHACWQSVDNKFNKTASQVGNQAFADYVDAHARLAHINNKKDPIPTLPPRAIGFVHPRGEIHILDNNEWVECPGQDNPSRECITSIFRSNLSDHAGPYDGVLMGC